MLPVIRTEQAEADFEEIIEYLYEHSPPAAENLTNLVEKRCQLLEHSPKLGRQRDELAPGLRSLAIDKYILFYRLRENAIEVVRILHGARDLQAFFDDANES